MRTKNTPVPPGPVAPLNLRFLWDIAPPAVLTLAYRSVLPAGARRLWARNSTSHIALRLILAGGGWRAFWLCALPHVSASGPSWFPEGGTLDSFPWSWLPTSAETPWPPTIPARLYRDLLD